MKYGKVKKAFALGLTAAMTASLFTGCSSNKNEETNGNNSDNTGTAVSSDDAISTDSPYYGKGYDLADHKTVVFYMVGDAPNDMDKVLQKANEEYFEPNLNTTLEMNFLNWSDYQTKYSLLLSGGEQVDLIYTAGWCYYNEEVSKGAFKELTMDWIQENMPYTYESQPTESWDQISIDGKIYAVPKAKSTFTSYQLVAYRQDLVDEYNLTVPTDWDTYKSYLFELADLKSTTGVTPLYTNTNRNQTLTTFLQDQKVEGLADGYDFYYPNNDSEAAPSSDDIFYLYTSDLYKQYCLEMAEWAAKGVWSSDAISDTSDVQAYFENGTSGAFVWNSSIYTAGKNLEAAGTGTYSVADITPDSLRRRASYSTDAIAITTNSKDQERAALVLDYMKNDVNLNRLLMGGIEGEHYELDADGNRVALDAASNYAWNNWAWAINRADEPDEAGHDQRQIDMDAKVDSMEYVPQTAGFTFDPSSVDTEMAVVNSVRDEYMNNFALGVFGDNTEAKLDEFVKKLQAAGLETIQNEILEQYNTYKQNKGL